jgi:hypothetical protein
MIPRYYEWKEGRKEGAMDLVLSRDATSYSQASFQDFYIHMTYKSPSIAQSPSTHEKRSMQMQIQIF